MLLLFLLLFIFCSSDCVSGADISLGSTITPSNPNASWSSPDNRFSLSFISSNSTPNSFSAAISFSGGGGGGGIPVWKAGGSDVEVDSSARFELQSNGNLRLTNGTGGLIWQSETSNRGVTVATLDNSGNLSLKNSSNNTLWSTFDNPTDTILPAQNFTSEKRLQSGSYSFAFLDSGNLTLTWNQLNQDIVYWNQAPNASIATNLSSPILGIGQDGVLKLSDPSLTGTVDMFYSSDYGEVNGVFRFLRLDPDGNLRMYTTDSSSTATPKWAAVVDQCRVYGWCGNMGICNYNGDNSTPVCTCPSQNFEFVDPNDARQGCKRKVELQGCADGANMLTLDSTLFLTYPPEDSSQVLYAGSSGCMGNCLQGTCVASTSLADGTGLCYFKNSNFLSGYHSPALPSTSYIKVCGPALPNIPSPSASQGGGGGDSNKLPAWVLALVLVASIGGLILVEAGLWFCCCRNSTKFGGLSAQYALLEYASGAPVQFSFKDLQRSTKGFKEKLGEGGFGAVYRGILANKTVVAVKQLEGIEQGEKQFRMEVATISSTHHLNLVRLIGFCSEGRHRLLVYEYMKNGSLDDSLFVKEAAALGRMLDWQTRFSVALGTARGITYLHEECRDCIVHCDIKPENILLDENFNAKVSDFGLAKLINSKDHRYRTLTSVRGTRGYLAPEWLANLPITSKSDIYSYGMVLLEIVSGRRNYEVSKETNRKKFSMWAYEEFERGNVKNVVDKRLGDHHLVDMEQVMRAIQVSFWCIQEQPSQRPTMGKVVQMLEGIMTIDKPPAPKVVTEGSISGSSISAISAFATSAQATSLSSQLGTSPSFSTGSKS